MTDEIAIGSTSESENDLSHAASAVIDGRPTQAAAILVKRKQLVALWIVDSFGEPCGAWTFDLSKKDEALTAAQILERRALLTLDRELLLKDLTALTEAAGATARFDSLDEYVCDLQSLLIDLRQSREQMEESLEREKKRAKELRLVRKDLTWPNEIPEVPESGLKAALKITRMRPSGKSIEAEAIDTSRVVSWEIQLWRGSEIMKSRRSYIGNDLGQPKPLPPSWIEAMAMAYENPLLNL